MHSVISKSDANKVHQPYISLFDRGTRKVINQPQRKCLNKSQELIDRLMERSRPQSPTQIALTDNNKKLLISLMVKDKYRQMPTQVKNKEDQHQLYIGQRTQRSISQICLQETQKIKLNESQKYMARRYSDSQPKKPEENQQKKTDQSKIQNGEQILNRYGRQQYPKITNAQYNRPKILIFKQALKLQYKDKIGQSAD